MNRRNPEGRQVLPLFEGPDADACPPPGKSPACGPPSPGNPFDGEEDIRPWLEDAPTEVMDATQALLVRVARLRTSQVVHPPAGRVFHALALTPPGDVHVVILGQDPYHEPGQAMGLAFSVPRGVRIPPSLRNIYRELSADLGCAVPTSGDLTAWARQGVLLLNTTLTVREHEANSHVRLGWQTLTSYVLCHVMGLPQPVVFLAWGRHAENLVDAARTQARAAGNSVAEKFVLASTHPSPLSASRAAGDLAPFLGSRPFSRANALLEAHGSTGVNWEDAGR